MKFCLKYTFYIFLLGLLGVMLGALEGRAEKAPVLLEDVSISSLKEGAVITFRFDQELPIYTLESRPDKKGLVVEFRNTRIGQTDWIRRIKDTLVKGIDIAAAGDGLRIELLTESPVSYQAVPEKKGLMISLRREKSTGGGGRVLGKQATEERVKKVGETWYEKIRLPETQEVQVPLTRSKYTGSPITVDFQNADIHAVLRLLAKVGGFNVVVSDTVKGTVTLRLENVPWDQVLDTVLASKGLGMIQVGNIVRVAPLDELREQARKIREIRQEQAQEEDVAPLETVYLQVNYAKAENVAKQIEKILSPRGEVTYEERTNQVILKDVPKVIREAKELLDRLDQPTKQVLIEARIVEIQDSYEHKLGIRWSGAGWRISEHTFTGLTPSTEFTIEESEWTEATQIKIGIDPGAIVDLGVAGTSRLGFTFGHVSSSSVVLLDVQLSALESEGVARIISAPRVITEDHQSAEIKQGFRIPYLRQTQDGISTEFVDAALKLKVTPHVTPDNRINLELEIEKNAPDFGRQVNGVPSIVTRYAKTRVFVQNGETVVIGGIIERNLSRSQDKVPGLGNLPGAGELFKNRQRSFAKNELIVFITPRIVSTDVKDLY